MFGPVPISLYDLFVVRCMLCHCVAYGLRYLQVDLPLVVYVQPT